MKLRTNFDFQEDRLYNSHLSCMTEIGRREFTRMLVAPFVGFAAGALMVPVGDGLNQEMQKLTGHPTGNAGIQSLAEESCKNAPDPKKCVSDFQLSDTEKTAATLISPIFEEAICRVLPSLMVSHMQHERSSLGTLIHGTGGLGMTRRELGVGLISSIVFGWGHNFTVRNEFDTNTIPIPLAAMGFGLWYLQRKFGVLANTIAHIVNNSLASH